MAYDVSNDDLLARVDMALFELEHEIDWLTRLSPLDNDQRWRDFVASGYKRIPPLTYPAIPGDFGDLRQKLFAIPVADVEHPILKALLLEKQRELDRLIELVGLRGSDGFAMASIDLFGGTGPRLMQAAEDILNDVVDENEHAELAGSRDLADAAQTAIDQYRSIDPSFASQVFVVNDLNSLLLVHAGDLYIARSATVPRERVAPLIAHEVGTHCVTRHNGRQQPLRALEAGLAHYDALQEGLGCFAEYLTGYLPPSRLRVLAARVIACDRVVSGASLEDIFSLLNEEYGVGAAGAFDVAVRAGRGGGLTKDAVYLRGLWELLAYLAEGGDLAPLYLGKFAMSQRDSIRSLLDEGILREPAILPGFVTSASARARLEQARQTPLDALYQERPVT
jgi:uncharacterized protein (TIGR02421 family)